MQGYGQLDQEGSHCLEVSTPSVSGGPSPWVPDFCWFAITAWSEILHLYLTHDLCSMYFSLSIRGKCACLLELPSAVTSEQRSAGHVFILSLTFLGVVGSGRRINRIYNIMPFSGDRLMNSFGYVRVKTKPWFCNNGLDRSCQTWFWVVKNIWKYFCQIIISTVLCWPWKSLLVLTNCSSHLYNLCEVGLVGFFEMNLYYH